LIPNFFRSAAGITICPFSVARVSFSSTIQKSITF
jgi:hypothetical protein